MFPEETIRDRWKNKGRAAAIAKRKCGMSLVFTSFMCRNSLQKAVCIAMCRIETYRTENSHQEECWR